jgi:uncharacterized membrane protein YdbT with pleckstrin-like domain
MFALNTAHRQPVAAFWYMALPAIVVVFFAIILGAFVRDTVASACVLNSCPYYVPMILPTFLIIFIVGVLAQPILEYVLFTYSLEAHAITINTGIIFRQYETITFSRIQTINLERGPLLWLFGLTEVRLWTASADQFNDHEDHSHAKPDTKLILDRDAAQEFKDFISGAKKAENADH